MTVIDPSTPVGKIRLRVGDWSDLPILPDSVINSALTDCGDNVPRAAQLCAQYILATLTFKTHKKLSSVEVWSGEQFDNYIQFIKTTILNPNFMSVAPIPYGFGGDENPLIAFVDTWNTEFNGLAVPF
jgi:hypothetical protein